ncbi:MAG: coproporphyrinogen III oxidase family protein [Deltaproteobacteria bacterium]|nr:coproporphyrinogen III oxidase family protein [Deltaproteobacteria bacterium]
MAGDDGLFARFEGETTGGGYFVSNYPPFAVWTPEAIAPEPAVLGRAPAEGMPLGVYVHVPFCRKRCHFCYFKVYTQKSSKDVAAYVEGLAREARMLATRPALRERSSRFLYVGGGTPSYLSVRQIQRLRKALSPLVDFPRLSEFTFECEPGTLSRPKLDALRELGVTRLSLGVESFDDRILALNGRAHAAKHIEAAYAAARAAQLPQINIDLIAGMVGEDDASWQASVARTVALAPDSVTIYQMEVPFNTTLYRETRTPDGVIAPVADWPTKRRWTREAFDALEAAGYALTSGYTAVRDPARATFVYRDSLWGGADMVGLGVSAFSHVAGTHYQNEKHLESYAARLEAGELPIQRGYVMTDEERLVRAAVLSLKKGVLDAAFFRERFGVDIFERFADAIALLEAHGLAAREGGTLRLTRDALLQVDRVLPAFFLPRHRASAGLSQPARPLAAGVGHV